MGNSIHACKNGISFSALSSGIVAMLCRVCPRFREKPCVIGVISKMWIRAQGKARGGAQSRRGGMSILSRPAIPPAAGPWGLRPVFEIGSSVASQKFL
jgi:hypothetical protein